MKKIEKSKYQIPFDGKGNQLDYPEALRDDLRWQDNEIFQDDLELVDYGRGRSSVKFVMKRSNGKTVSAFVSDFFEMAKRMTDGRISGRFTFQKKGANYGCRLAQ